MNSLDLNGPKIHAIYLVSFKMGCMMTWCNAHDAMMNATNQTNHTTKTRKSMKASEAPVLGRYIILSMF